MAEDIATTPEVEDAQAAQPSVDELMAQVKALTDERDKAVAESRKWEGRSKKNSAAAKELDEIRKQSMSDAERADSEKARADQAEAELAEYRAKAERDEIVASVASERGIDREWLARMSGSTREEVEANADFLASKLEGTPIYPSVPDAGHKQIPDKKSPQDSFAAFMDQISRRN